MSEHDGLPSLHVRLMGGPADEWEYQTLIEPPAVITMLADPFHPDRWIRVVGPWGGAFEYARVPSVEQFDHERIYYPVV